MVDVVHLRISLDVVYLGSRDSARLDTVDIRSSQWMFLVVLLCKSKSKHTRHESHHNYQRTFQTRV